MNIYVIARPSIDEAELTRYLRDHNHSKWQSTSTVDSERVVEIAGRVCYDSFSSPRPGGNKAYIENILDSKHGAVTEHANYTLLFAGVTRNFSHELVRHRAGWSYSQRSQRYVDESESGFVAPDLIKGDPELMDMWQETVYQSQDIYKKLAEKIIGKMENPESHLHSKFKNSTKTDKRKAARGAARSVLSPCIETQIVVTANVRAWRHFVELRGAMPAEHEIRQLACNVAKIMKKEAPNLFMDIEVRTADDFKDAVFVKYAKV